MLLNKGHIKQGDSETITIPFVNRSELSDSSPVKVSGFLTVGWVVRFIAKRSKFIPDDEAVLNKSSQEGGGISVIDADTAVLAISPADTVNIPITESKKAFCYEIQFSNSDGTASFTIEEGYFLLIKNIAIFTP
jgi:hypothetical protein